MISIPEQLLLVSEVQLLEVGVGLQHKDVLLDDSLYEAAHV